jgi:hypothetical protein
VRGTNRPNDFGIRGNHCPTWRGQRKVKGTLLTSPSVAPAVVVLGGPNGAGKSTAAPRPLRGSPRVDEFVNADTLAQGLSAFRPQDVALEAGQITLKRLDDLESQRRGLAVESTVSSHALAKRLTRMQQIAAESTSGICGCPPPTSPFDHTQPRLGWQWERRWNGKSFDAVRFAARGGSDAVPTFAYRIILNMNGLRGNEPER